MLWFSQNPLRARLIDVRVLEQAEANLHLQDRTVRGFDLLHAYLPVLNCRGKVPRIGREVDGHFHVDAGIERTDGGVGKTFGEVMLLETFHRVGIAYYKAGEIPLIAKHIM